MASGISHNQKQITVLDFLYHRKGVMPSNSVCENSLLLKKRHCRQSKNPRLLTSHHGEMLGNAALKAGSPLLTEKANLVCPRLS